MKDIENYKLDHVQGALKRLDQAVTRLESAAGKVQAARGGADGGAALAQEFDQLTRAHGALKATAGGVAQRLDAAIGRLAALVQD